MYSTPRRLAAVFALAVVAVGGTAAVADAYRGPTGKERAAITRAVKSSEATGAFPTAPTASRASAYPPPTPPYASGRLAGRRVPPATVVVRRSRGTWRLKTIGTADLGCGLPRAVRSHLRLGCR